MNNLERPRSILSHARFPFITLLGGNGDAEAGKYFPWWKQKLNWLISKILFRHSYQVAPGLYKSKNTFTESPEIFDYEDEEY
jgi:hypothetical protein